MTMAQTMSPSFPIADSGYFHLTEGGWVRKDQHPFPPGRLETWRYEMECSSDVDKERVHLTRVWSGNKSDRAELLRKRYGDAITPAHERHIVIDCNG